jgi:inosose dehydratase
MHEHPSTWLSRREFLAAGLATAGALSLGRSAGALDTAGNGDYGPFKMGIQSYSLRQFKFDEALQKTKELGLAYWESFSAHIPAVTEADKVETFKKRAAESGVSVIGYGVIRFTNDHDANRRLFEFGKLIGLGYLSADPDPDSFSSLDRLVEEFGIGVGIHNHGPGSRYEKIDTIASAIKDHHEKIGCCIDTGHFLRSREDPVRAVEVFGKRIFGVHLKDVKDASTFTILGKGDLRTAELLKGLARLKYNYCLALEYEENPAAPIDDIRACLAEVRRAIASL